MPSANRIPTFEPNRTRGDLSRYGATICVSRGRSRVDRSEIRCARLRYLCARFFGAAHGSGQTRWTVDAGKESARRQLEPIGLRLLTVCNFIPRQE